MAERDTRGVDGGGVCGVRAQPEFFAACGFVAADPGEGSVDDDCQFDGGDCGHEAGEDSPGIAAGGRLERGLERGQAVPQGFSGSATGPEPNWRNCGGSREILFGSRSESGVREATLADKLDFQMQNS